MNSANIASGFTAAIQLKVFAQAVRAMNCGDVFADDGSSWDVICTHGDTSNSVEMVRAITTTLKQSN
jgi:lactam utilization protein B